jgi:hypothetical protein
VEFLEATIITEREKKQARKKAMKGKNREM